MFSSCTNIIISKSPISKNVGLALARQNIGRAQASGENLGTLLWLLSMHPREPPERAAHRTMPSQSDVTERRGGARVTGDERTEPLVENECVVCPATLGDGRKAIPRDYR